MICRKIHKDASNHVDIVWFGSYGREPSEYEEKTVLVKNVPTYIYKDTKKNYADVSFYLNNLEPNSNVDVYLDPTERDQIAIKLVRLTQYNPTTDEKEVLDEFEITGFDNVFEFDVYLDGDGFTGLFVEMIDVYYPGTITNAEVTFTSRKYASLKSDSQMKSFAEKQEGVMCSLTQRLNVIKGELWYNVNEGLPLFDKETTITSMDAYVIRTVMRHPDVINIISFTSSIENRHEYTCSLQIQTKYGILDMTV